MKQAFIKFKRRSSRHELPVRVRADFVTAIMETMEKVGDKDRAGVRIHLGNNNHIDVIDETIDSVWNKLTQAAGTNIVLIEEVSCDYPGHPDYGRQAAA